MCNLLSLAQCIQYSPWRINLHCAYVFVYTHQWTAASCACNLSRTFSHLCSNKRDELQDRDPILRMAILSSVSFVFLRENFVSGKKTPSLEYSTSKQHFIFVASNKELLRFNPRSTPIKTPASMIICLFEVEL